MLWRERIEIGAAGLQGLWEVATIEAVLMYCMLIPCFVSLQLFIVYICEDKFENDVCLFLIMGSGSSTRQSFKSSIIQIMNL